MCDKNVSFFIGRKGKKELVVASLQFAFGRKTEYYETGFKGFRSYI